MRADQVGALARHWHRRSAAEAGVAISFEALLPRLRDIGAERVVLELTAKAIEDERRHAALCLERARAFVADLPVPRPLVESLPEFETGDEALECALLLLGMSCINESIACEWLRAGWNSASDAEAKSLFHDQLKDEVDHARIGWAHFASRVVTPAMKEVLRTRWLERMLDVNLREWRKPDEYLPLEGIPELGHISQADSLIAIETAVRDVIRPGFAHVGLTGSSC